MKVFALQTRYEKNHILGSLICSFPFTIYIYIFTLGAAALQFLFSDQTIQFGTFTSPFRVQYDDRIFDVLDLVETINPLGMDVSKQMIATDCLV